MKRNPSIAAILLAAGVSVTLVSLWLSRDPQLHQTPPGSAPPQAANLAPAAPDGPVLAQEKIAKHIPDRELFGSTWELSPRAELASFGQWVRKYLDAAPAA